MNATKMLLAAAIARFALASFGVAFKVAFEPLGLALVAGALLCNHK